MAVASSPVREKQAHADNIILIEKKKNYMFAFSLANNRAAAAALAFDVQKAAAAAAAKTAFGAMEQPPPPPPLSTRATLPATSRQVGQAFSLFFSFFCPSFSAAATTALNCALLFKPTYLVSKTVDVGPATGGAAFGLQTMAPRSIERERERERKKEK